jgi:hypothetical protein
VTSAEPFSGIWQAQKLRLTAFPSGPATPTQNEWWRETLGEPPETRTVREREATIDEEGRIQGEADRPLVVTFHWEPLRMDWRVRAQDAPEDARAFGPNLRDVLPWFVGGMQRWLPLAPPIQRLAFGAELALPVDDHAAGNSALRVLTRLDIPQDGRDFFYQLNRRRSSRTVPDLLVNRLAKWSLLTVRVLQVRVADSPRAANLDQAFACRLELDMNTAPEWERELPQESLPALFAELVELGVELSERGDIP